MMMFCTKTPPKGHFKEEEIQPWNSDESNMMNLFIESSEEQTNRNKKAVLPKPAPQKERPYRLLKEGNSYNFYTNLRKYEKKKAEDFLSKKDVNFIQRNIKGISEDLSNYQEQSPQSLVDKMIQDKNQRSKMIHNEFSSTIQPINWNLITQHEENKAENRHRHKMFQNFIRFQSQNHRKDSFKQICNEETLENTDQSSKFDSEKYQKLLKMRQSLRKRNLKSSDESRRKLDNTLNIQQNCKSSKLASIQKIGSFLAPKTSHAARRRSIQISNDSKVDQVSSASYWTRTDRGKLYSSHQNRVKLSLKAIN